MTTVKGLPRPDGKNPDRFAIGVAAAYHTALRTNRKPAKAIAEASGVPVTTVHRWIREARRRGKLEPFTNGLERVAADLGVDPRVLAKSIRRHAPGWLR